MEDRTTNWVKEVALEHCLLDPRIDRDLRFAIAKHVLSSYMKEGQEEVVSTEVLFEDDVIVVHKYDLPKGDKSYVAVGNKIRKQEIQSETLALRKYHLEFIKSIIHNALKNQLEPEIENVPLPLLEFTLNYYEQVKKKYKYRIKQIISSFSDELIEKNQEYTKNYKPKVRQSDVHTSSEGLDLIQSTINVGEQSLACFATTAGRPKLRKTRSINIPKLVTLPLTQEDRGGVALNIELHESWKGRIPELLAYVQQKLILDVYKNIPIKNWCNVNNNNNISKAGSTLTMLFRYEDRVFVLFLGDSPAALFNTDIISNKTKIKLLTFAHRPGTHESEQNEYYRIILENGSVTSDIRLANPFGDMAMSRAIGDLEARGMSDIGSISVTKLDSLKYKIALGLFCDGVTDFLSLEDIKEFYKMVKFEDFATCLCTEAYKNPRNRDNITSIGLPDADKLFSYLCDGHGDKCVAEYIDQTLPNLFRSIAKSPAPDVIMTKKHTVKRYRVDMQDEKESPKQEYNYPTVPNLSFFQSSIETNTVLSYDSSILIKKIKECSFFYESSRGEMEKSLLEGELKSSFFILEATHLPKNHYVIHYLKEDNIKHVVFYIPTEFPMSYAEYSEIYNRKNVIINEHQLDNLILSIQDAKDLDFESEELTQPTNN